MGNDGYIRLSRKFFKNEYWTKKRSFSQAEAWIDLIQIARFEAEPAKKMLPNGRQISIERGEIHASLRYLSVRWGWGLMQVRTFLRKAVETHQITQRVTQGENIITLSKYDDYNPLNFQNNTPDNTPYSTPITHRQHTGNTNNNKENKENKEKKENNKPPTPLKGEFDFSFINPEFLESFYQWLSYKKEKKQAYKSQNSLQACYNHLMNLSENDFEKAKQIINQSIANNWSGLFELKEKKTNSNNFKNNFLNDLKNEKK